MCVDCLINIGMTCFDTWPVRCSNRGRGMRHWRLIKNCLYLSRRVVIMEKGIGIGLLVLYLNEIIRA